MVHSIGVTRTGRTADKWSMIKTIGLVGILCALALTGLSWAQKSFQTTEKAPTAVLDAAAVALEFSHRTTGTYAAKPPEGVTLAWGDVNRYCIEYEGYFVSGPGGTPTKGSCPR
jgi:hypothetical protein